MILSLPKPSRILRLLKTCSFLILCLLVFSHLDIAIAKEKSPPGKKINVFKKLGGYLNTVNKGVGGNDPPNIKVFHTKEGLLFQLHEFKKIRNRQTREKAVQLIRELRQVNFKTNMVVAVFTLPTDNYAMTIKNIVDVEDRIEIDITYKHKEVKYQILPALKIYYHFFVMKKNHLPVLLKSRPLLTRKKKKTESLQTVFGRLLEWDNAEYTMGLVRKIKGKKHHYYIREPKWIEKLKPLIGKKVGLRGYIRKEQGSIYEAEIRVKEIVKVVDATQKKH